MAAAMASALPTLIFPTLSLYISKVWSSPHCQGSRVPLADLDNCDLGIADASVGLTCLGFGLSGGRGGDGVG